MYTVYIIKNSKDRYYVGFTSNMEKCLIYHNSGKNSSTKNKGPWNVVYEEAFGEKKDAWLRERQIKKYKGGNAFKKLIKPE